MRKNKKELKQNENASLVEIMSKQAARINELKEENADLLIALESYRRKESEIASTLAFAKKQAEEIVGAARVKYALECERIKLCRDKWTDYLTDKISRRKLADSIQESYDYLAVCQKELETMMADFDSSPKEQPPEQLPEPEPESVSVLLSPDKIRPEELSDAELEYLLSQLKPN